MFTSGLAGCDLYEFCLQILVCVRLRNCFDLCLSLCESTMHRANLSMHSSAFVCVWVQACDCALRCDCTVSLSGFVCQCTCMFVWAFVREVQRR